MKTKSPYLLLIAFLFSGIFSYAQSSGCLEKFSWLGGSWSMTKNGTTTAEIWRQGKDAMECRSYEIKGQDSSLVETTKISCIAGKHVFTYYPVLKDENDRREPVLFVLVSEENNTFIFENKEHDFPQRVVYQKKGDAECHAWIEGTENGAVKKFDFNYVRNN